MEGRVKLQRLPSLQQGSSPQKGKFFRRQKFAFLLCSGLFAAGEILVY